MSGSSAGYILPVIGLIGSPVVVVVGGGVRSRGSYGLVADYREGEVGGGGGGGGGATKWENHEPVTFPFETE